MPRMQFGITAFERARGDLPELPVINMFAEQAATEATGVVLQSRPGLATYIMAGSGPIRQIYSADGTLDGGAYCVSGNDLYAGTTLLGTIDGPGHVSIAGYSDLLFVAAGGGLWTWDQSVLVNVAFPDSANVRKVLTGASRAICIRADSEKFYWSNVLSSTIGALSFASAESQTDQIFDALFIDDVLVLFGSETTEFWPNTGDADLPFQPLEGRVFEVGVKATGCAVQFGTSFAWVTNNNQVCIGDPANVVSNPGLDALIEATATPVLWTFTIEGTSFLALRINSGTWIYSNASKTWSQFATSGLSNWDARCHSRGYFGSATDGTIYRWGAEHLDDGGVLERRFRAGFPLNAGGVTVNNVILRTNPGQTPYTSGTYANPTVEMRRSLDGGQTWGNWRAVSLGEQGKYRQKVQWTGCGMAGQPGWLAEFRVSDPVPFRVSEALINEPFGGI